MEIDETVSTNPEYPTHGLYKAQLAERIGLYKNEKQFI